MFFRKRRRRKLQQTPPPPSWQDTLERLPLYQRLPESLRPTLHGHMQVLLDEKNFEGCGGFEVDEAAKVSVLAHAALPLLSDPLDYYPLLSSILLYPAAFMVDHEEDTDFGVVESRSSIHLGESWSIGAIVLSWRDIRRDIRTLDGSNVVLHEFAHQFHEQGGPTHLNRQAQAKWMRSFDAAYDAHAEAVERGRDTFLDPYGAEEIEEFFAVGTEYFFEIPEELAEEHPKLYQLFQQCYQLDPAAWPRPTAES